MPAVNTRYLLVKKFRHQAACSIANLHEDAVAANADNAVVVCEVEGRRHLPGMPLVLGL